MRKLTVAPENRLNYHLSHPSLKRDEVVIFVPMSAVLSLGEKAIVGYAPTGEINLSGPLLKRVTLAGITTPCLPTV